MAQTVDISKNRYEELKKNPVFFLKFYNNIRYDEQGNIVDCSTWRSLDSDLNITFDAGNFANRTLGYTLCIIEKAEEKKDDKGNVIPDVLKMTFHSASSDNVNDWIIIINSFVIRSSNKEDKYAFMELLWALDKLQWNSTTLILAFSRYPSQTKSFLITNFQKFGRILSYYKQEALQIVFAKFKGKYNIYSPVNIEETYYTITNAINPSTHLKWEDLKGLNLFSIVDNIFDLYLLVDYDVTITTTNILLVILSWFYGDASLDDYNVLLRIIPTLSEKYRLLFIKRYFHDIRNQYTSFDISFLQSIKNSKYDEFVRYRYCIESPAEPIVLTVPLLCDTLITLFNSKGNSFQTFDGVLDFAMTHCDTVHPAIDFKLERLIPTCNGGAVYNKESFKGFIDYAVIRKINKGKLTDEHLRSTFICLMDKHAQKQKYPACKYGDGTKISDEEFKHCAQVRNTKANVNEQIRESTWSLGCFHY